MSSYSVDLIKRAAFEDELRNYLNIDSMFAKEDRNEKWCAITEYLQERMNDIDQKYGIAYDEDQER